MDLNELDVNDIKEISKQKAIDAYNVVGSPVFVSDSGFYIINYPNSPFYPGAFVKRSGVSSNVDELLEKMKFVHDRRCYFMDCLTFYDGKNSYQFFGNCNGVLSTEKRENDILKAKSNLWYIFIPNNCSKTLAEMNDYERNNRNDGRVSAIDKFIAWYKNDYLGSKFLENSDKEFKKNVKMY